LDLDGYELLDQLTKTEIAVAVGVAKYNIYTDVSRGKRTKSKPVWVGSRLNLYTREICV
jgi:hypothetical protein